MKTLGERIAHIQSKTGARCLQDAANIPQSTLSRYIRNQSVPPVDRVVAMATAGGVSAGWLAAGEDLPALQPSHPEQPSPITEAACHRITFSTEHMAALSNQPEQLRTYAQSSDAMHPTLQKDALTLIDTSQNSALEGIYLLEMMGQLSIRRLQPAPNGTLQVLSDNPAYQAHTLQPDELNNINIRGRVVWYESRC